MFKQEYRVGVIGLGYVGSPLLNDILKKNIKVVGYDISIEKINFLNKKNKKLKNYISNNSSILKDCNIYIVCVPTPVNSKRKPNLEYLKRACLLISKYINKNNIIIFESTVYPGVTRNFCLSILKK